MQLWCRLKIRSQLKYLPLTSQSQSPNHQQHAGGGSGFIGSRLRSRLTAAGYDVTIVSRMPGLKRITWHELEQKGLPERTHAVVNVAGQNVLDPMRRWTPG